MVLARLRRERTIECRLLNFTDWKFQIGALRYQVFGVMLGWLPRRKSGLELDPYDRRAVHFGVVSTDAPDALLAYARVLFSGSMMVDYPSGPFRRLLTSKERRVLRSAAEISRNCGVPGLVQAGQISALAGKVQVLLYCSIVEYLRRRGCSGVLAEVVDDTRMEKSKRPELLAKGTVGYSYYQQLVETFAAIGKSRNYQPGVTTVCIYAKLSDCQKYLSRFDSSVAILPDIPVAK